MEEMMKQASREIADLCIKLQAKLGGDNTAVVCVMNGLMHAMTQYVVQTTTSDREEGQKRFNVLSMKIAKVMQEFVAEHTGGAAIIELPEEP